MTIPDANEPTSDDLRSLEVAIWRAGPTTHTLDQRRLRARLTLIAKFDDFRRGFGLARAPRKPVAEC